MRWYSAMPPKQLQLFPTSREPMVRRSRVARKTAAPRAVQRCRHLVVQLVYTILLETNREMNAAAVTMMTMVSMVTMPAVPAIAMVAMMPVVMVMDRLVAAVVRNLRTVSPGTVATRVIRAVTISVATAMAGVSVTTHAQSGRTQRSDERERHQNAFQHRTLSLDA